MSALGLTDAILTPPPRLPEKALMGEHRCCLCWDQRAYHSAGICLAKDGGAGYRRCVRLEGTDKTLARHSNLGEHPAFRPSLLGIVVFLRTAVRRHDGRACSAAPHERLDGAKSEPDCTLTFARHAARRSCKRAGTMDSLTVLSERLEKLLCQARAQVNALKGIKKVFAREAKHLPPLKKRGELFLLSYCLLAHS